MIVAVSAAVGILIMIITVVIICVIFRSVHIQCNTKMCDINIVYCGIIL